MADPLFEPLLAALVLLLGARLLRNRVSRGLPAALPAVAVAPAGVGPSRDWGRIPRDDRRQSR